MGKEMLFVELIPPTSNALFRSRVGVVRGAQYTKGETKGRLKDAAGKATNDRSLQAKGKGDKAAGNLKQAGEKVKDAFRK